MKVLDRDRPETADELLSQYLERDLDDESTSELRHLLQQDPETREDMEFLRKMVNTLGQMEDVEAPPQFVQQVRRRVRRQRNSERMQDEMKFRPPYEMVVVLLVAAMAVLLFLLLTPAT
jgi:anti-sigma factor RsiW